MTFSDATRGSLLRVVAVVDIYVQSTVVAGLPRRKKRHGRSEAAKTARSSLRRLGFHPLLKFGNNAGPVLYPARTDAREESQWRRPALAQCFRVIADSTYMGRVCGLGCERIAHM